MRMQKSLAASIVLLFIVAASILVPVAVAASQGAKLGISILQAAGTTATDTNTNITTSVTGEAGANVTVDVNATTTTTVTISVETLRALVIVYINALKHVLASLNLTNASATDIATALGVDAKLAEKIVYYASMNTSIVQAMPSDQLVAVYKDVKETYEKLVDIIEERVEQEERVRATERVKARLALEVMTRLEKQAREWNDTSILNTTMEIRKALEAGDLARAWNLTLALSDYLSISNSEKIAMKLEEKLVKSLEKIVKLASKENQTIPREALEDLEELVDDVKEFNKVVKERMKVGVDVLEHPDKLAKLLTSSDTAAGLSTMLGQLLNETRAGTGNMTPRAGVALVASEWADKLRARISVLANLSQNITDSEFAELVSEANTTLSLAEAMIESGDYASAMHLLGRTESIVVKAEALARLYLLKESMKKNFKEIEERMKWARTNIMDIIKLVEKKHPELANTTTSMLLDKVEKAIAQAESTIQELVNKTANMTVKPKSIEELLEKATENLEEAKKLLEEAVKAIDEGDYIEAQEKLVEALGHATRASNYATIALGLLETKMLEEHVVKMKLNITDITEKIVRKKMGERTENATLHLLQSVEEHVNEATAKLALVESMINKSNVSLPQEFTVALNKAKEYLAKAEELLAAARQALNEGNETKAMALLVEARTYAVKAYRTAEKLEDAIEHLLEEAKEARKRAGEELNEVMETVAKTSEALENRTSSQEVSVNVEVKASIEAQVKEVGGLIEETNKLLALIKQTGKGLPKKFMEPLEKAQRLAAKASELLASAQQALREGNIDEAVELLKEARSYASEAHSIAEELMNSIMGKG